MNAIIVICDMQSYLRRLAFILTGYRSPLNLSLGTSGRDLVRQKRRAASDFQTNKVFHIGPCCPYSELAVIQQQTEVLWWSGRERMYVSGRGSDKILENAGHATPIERRYSHGNDFKSEHDLPKVRHLPVAWHSKNLGSFCSQPSASGLRVAV